MAVDTSLYSLVRPPPTLFNQLGEAQALRRGEQEIAAGKQRLRVGEQVISQNDEQARTAAEARAMQQKIGQVMSQSVGQDGAPDEAKLRQGFLADPQLAPHWPDVQANITKAKEATAKLRETFQKVDADDDEKVAAMEPLLKAANYDPAVAAKLLQEVGPGFSPEKQRDLLQQIQSNPTPQAVQQIFVSRASADKTQATNAHLAAETAGAAELAADRKAKSEDEKASRALANASKQLYMAASRDKTGAQYADVYAGLPADLQGKFDAPARFDDSTAERALQAAMTPDQITQRTETAKRDAAVNADRDAAREQARLTAQATAAYRKASLDKRGGAQKDAEEERDFRNWSVAMARAKSTFDAQLESWKLEHPFATEDTVKESPPPKFVPPPDYPTFREKREDDRGHSTPKKSVTQSQLEAVAKLRGTTVEVQRKRAEAEGFAIAPK